MYRNCIFCSALLGANDVLEEFPVGRQIAFDGWKGRLWAICPSCSRWNLSPIDERWEAVESAEKLFRDARLRVQSENVGLAQLPDGTRLIRVGKAVPGEMAAWRYGRQLRRRRKRYFIGVAGSVAASLAIYGGLTAMGTGVIGLLMGNSWIENRRKQKVLHRVRLPEPPEGLVRSAGNEILIRRWHLEGISLHSTDHDVEVHVRDAHRKKPGGMSGQVNRRSKDVAAVSGDEARALLKRLMVHVNHAGATRSGLKQATRVLIDAGTAEQVVRQAAQRGVALGKRAGRAPDMLEGPDALAFEMALNEESERRALEGELAGLEAAWREAEEIAAIADSLPGEATFNRLLDRLAR